MRRIERIAIALGVLGLVASIGCSTKISTTHDPFVLFPSTAQYTWDESMNRMPTDPTMQKLNVEATLRKSIVASLAKRGYTLAEEGAAARFRAHYQLGLGEVIGTDSAEAFASLSLTLVDSETNRSAWVGFIDAPVDLTVPEAERHERLHERMDKMLKDFPPSHAN